MSTRTRKHGTKETMPETGAERIAAVRDVVENGYAKIDGETVDFTTASAIGLVYDHITPVQQEDYAKRPVGKMATMAWKLLTRRRREV